MTWMATEMMMTLRMVKIKVPEENILNNVREDETSSFGSFKPDFLALQLFHAETFELKSQFVKISLVFVE